MLLWAFAHALFSSWDIFLLCVTFTKLTLPCLPRPQGRCDLETA